MSLDGYVLTGLRVSLDIVNRLTTGMSRGVTYECENAIENLQVILLDDPPSVQQLQDHHISEFQRLAVSLREIIELLSKGAVELAAKALNELLAHNPATPVLSQEQDGLWRLHHHPINAELPSMWSAICAEGLAREIGNQKALRFGVCSAHQCDRVYFDTSRNGKRQYCSMACQNRVKAATFRKRHAP